MERKIPGPLWIAIIGLSVMVMGKVLAVFSVGPLVLIDAVLSGILLYGIVKGCKWAYFLTFVAVVIGTVIGLNKSVQNGCVVLVFDCLVLVPVIMCTDYFIPKGVSDT